MADGVNTRALQEFRTAFAEYIRVNTRELGPLLESRATRLRLAIFRAFRAIVPPREKIEAEAAARDFHIRRRKGRDGQTLSVAQEIAARKRSRGYLAASFIFRAWRAQPQGQSASFASRSKESGQAIGFAEVRTNKGRRRPFVEIGSLLEGAVVQEAKGEIFASALHEQVADMRAYLARKLAERRARLLKPRYA